MKLEKLAPFLDTLGLDEPPMGLFYTDTKPEKGFSPGPATLPTREREKKNEIDWQQVFSGFACVMGKIWLARKKHTAAYISAEQFGCPGAVFWLGFMKPQDHHSLRLVGHSGSAPWRALLRITGGIE